MEFQWDLGNLDHVAEHDLDSSEVEVVFYNDPIDLWEGLEEGEYRFHIAGHSDSNPSRTLKVVYTLRGAWIRVCTAFKLTNDKELLQYAEHRKRRDR